LNCYFYDKDLLVSVELSGLTAYGKRGSKLELKPVQLNQGTPNKTITQKKKEVNTRNSKYQRTAKQEGRMQVHHQPLLANNRCGNIK
jgi:hypothetical protein